MTVATTPEAIILAGGLGTRLAGVIGDCPKAMAPVAGRPFLEWQLDYLITQGITRVILSVGHLAERIVTHFGDRYRSVAIEYVREETPLGTGGALKAALARVEGRGAFVLNGDTLLPGSLSPIEGRASDSVVLAVHEVPVTAGCGKVLVENGRAVAFIEQGDSAPGWANAGVYWLRRGLFADIPMPDAFSFERDFLARQVSSLRPRAEPMKERFLDIGVPSTYAAAQSSIPLAIDAIGSRKLNDEPLTMHSHRSVDKNKPTEDFLRGVDLLRGFNKPEEHFVWSQYEFEVRFIASGTAVVLLCNFPYPQGVLVAQDAAGRATAFELTTGENWLLFRLHDDGARNLRCDVSPKIQQLSDIRELGVMMRHAHFFGAYEMATAWASARGHRLVEGRPDGMATIAPAVRVDASVVLYQHALRNGLKNGWLKFLWADAGQVDAAKITAIFYPPIKCGTAAPERFELIARGDVDPKAVFINRPEGFDGKGIPDGFLVAEMLICTAPKAMADAKFDIVVRDAWLNEDVLPWQSYCWRGYGTGSLPGAEEIRRVTGAVGISRFALGGAMVYSKVERIAARYLGKNLDQLTQILDWGCGCGRVFRFAPKSVRQKITGVDIDCHNVDWCRKNYDDVEVLAIDPDPPTPFNDARFDLIYGQSVFTHLTEASQFEWLSEHRRLLRPGGICAVTIASELGWSVMLGAQRDAYQYADYLERGIRDSGRLDIGVDESKPGYYRNTWHTTDYVVRRWSEYFDILDIIEGCADFQAMVVMRRR